MVARDSPNWLPAGWSVQFSPLKTGRRVQNFVNIETGKKFSSKDDVLHYIKMVNSAHGEPLSTNRHIERSSGRNPLQLINKKTKKPEWLPKGWKMELKTRKSGGRSGVDYKCYIDPLNRYKFYSKPQVFRYLSTVKHKNHMFKKKKTGISVHSAKKVAVDKKKVEDLPPRQIKEIRITRSSNEIKKDPVAVDKKKVEDLPPRRLKEIRITRSSNEIKKDPVAVDQKKVEDLPPRRLKEIRITRSSNEIKKDPVAVDKKKVEDLPPRQIKEIRISRSSNAIKKDPVAVDKKKVEDLPPRRLKEIRITRSSNEIKKDLVAVDKKKVEGLPPRRIKEIRITRSSNAIEKDPVAVDKKKVEDLPPRRLKEIRITRSSNEIKKDLPSSEAKRQKLKHPATRSQLFSGEKSSGMSDLEQSEIGVSKRSCCRRAPTEARVASAHRAEIIQEKHSFVNAIQDSSETKQNCAVDGSPQSKVEGTKSNQGKRSLLSVTDESKKSQGKGYVENGLASTPAPDMLQEKNLIQPVTEKQSFRKPQMNTGRSKNKKNLNLARRSSKRLAGIEPDQVVKLVSAEQGPKVAIGKLSNTGAILDAGLSSNSMLDGEFGQETELAHHAFSGINTSLYGVSSNMRIEPSADQVAHVELKQKPESVKEDNETPESHIGFLFGSDPCLEFAFKTLTGELPVTDAADGWDNLSTTAGNLQAKNLHESGMKKSSDGTNLVHLKISKKKKGITLPKRSSKRLAGLEPELVADSLAGEGELKNATRKSHKNEATRAEDLADETIHQPEPVPETELGNNFSPNIETSTHSEPSGKQCNNGHKVELANHFSANTDTLVHEESSNKQLDAGPETEFPNLNINISMHEEPSNKQLDSGKEVEPANYFSNNIDLSTHGEPSNKSEKSPEDLVVPEKQPQVQGQIPDLEKPDPQVAFSLGDCWSDPCLDFAFKTLTGEIPIEDNLVQGYFQEQLDTSHSQRNGSLALPDFGSLSFFQSDISSHFDSPEKSASAQQLSTNSSFLPAGNANLPSCNGVHSQQHCLESDKDFHGKVKS